MKKYRDIENLRKTDVELSGNVRKNNIGAFESGDEVVVQEKIDGSCASFHYLGNGEFEAYSRRKKLDIENNLNGFYQYCIELATRIDEKEKKVMRHIRLVNELTGGEAAPWEGRLPEKEDYFDYDKFIIFGEWTGVRNKIVYDKNPMKDWFVFDVYDIQSKRYLKQSIVDLICEEIDVKKVHTLAIIPSFINWETILMFANPDYSAYGPQMEGIVVKNQSKLDVKLREPVYIKFVNKDFREIKNIKNIDPEKEKEKEIAMEYMSQIVTANRIEKVISKLVEDNLIPSPNYGNKDLPILAKHVPRAVYVDCVKEEPEIVAQAGKLAGKICSTLVMQFIKNNLVDIYVKN